MKYKRKSSSNHNLRQNSSSNFDEINDLYENQGFQYSLNDSMDFYKDDGSKKKKIKKKIFYVRLLLYKS